MLYTTPDGLNTGTSYISTNYTMSETYHAHAQQTHNKHSSGIHDEKRLMFTNVTINVESDVGMWICTSGRGFIFQIPNHVIEYY